jgi:hypothetical protein
VLLPHRRDACPTEIILRPLLNTSAAVRPDALDGPRGAALQYLLLAVARDVQTALARADRRLELAAHLLGRTAADGEHGVPLYGKGISTKKCQVGRTGLLPVRPKSVVGESSPKRFGHSAPASLAMALEVLIGQSAGIRLGHLVEGPRTNGKPAWHSLTGDGIEPFSSQDRPIIPGSKDLPHPAQSPARAGLICLGPLTTI